MYSTKQLETSGSNHAVTGRQIADDRGWQTPVIYILLSILREQQAVASSCWHIMDPFFIRHAHTHTHTHFLSFLLPSQPFCISSPSFCPHYLSRWLSLPPNDSKIPPHPFPGEIDGCKAYLGFDLQHPFAWNMPQKQKLHCAIDVLTYSRGIRSSRIWLCVIRLAVPDVSKGRGYFVFCGQDSLLSGLIFEMGTFRIQIRIVHRACLVSGWSEMHVNEKF
jgi:hypothetical protein